LRQIIHVRPIFHIETFPIIHVVAIETDYSHLNMHVVPIFLNSKLQIVSSFSTKLYSGRVLGVFWNGFEGGAKMGDDQLLFFFSGKKIIILSEQ